MIRIIDIGLIRIIDNKQELMRIIDKGRELIREIMMGQRSVMLVADHAISDQQIRRSAPIVLTRDQHQS